MVVAAFLVVFSSTTGSTSFVSFVEVSTSFVSFVGVSEVFTETVFVAVFNEKTFGPLSPSSFWTNPCFLAESCPKFIASAKRFRTNLIVLEESSFIGMKFVRFVGLLLVSTRPYTGIPIFIASWTAIFSLSTSITSNASGKPFISLTPSKTNESFFISFSNITASFLIIESSWPDDLFSSYSSSLFIGTLIVFQLVSIPPSHLWDM